MTFCHFDFQKSAWCKILKSANWSVYNNFKLRKDVFKNWTCGVLWKKFLCTVIYYSEKIHLMTVNCIFSRCKPTQWFYSNDFSMDVGMCVYTDKKKIWLKQCPTNVSPTFIVRKTICNAKRESTRVTTIVS